MRVVRVPTAQTLDECLHVGRQVLGQLLGRLGEAGLAERNSAGHWTPTVLGGAALATGHYAATSHERRAFYFRESEQPGRLPSFLPLSHPATTPWPVGENWEFNLGLLQACAAQSLEWKERRGFPPEVDEICLMSAPEERPSPSEPWRQVVVHRPERLFTLLVLQPSDAGPERFLGFTIQQDGWVLNTSAPALALGSSWPESFPELADDPPLEQWRLAWRSWCQPRGLAEGASDAFALERAGHRLRVLAPGRFVDKLRAARSDALKGEAWMLAGEGRVRAAALLEIIQE